MAIDLLPPEPQGSVSFDNENPITDERVLANKVQKADYALGDASPGQPQISRMIQLGLEESVRQTAANQEALRLRQEYLNENRQIFQLATLEGRDLTPEEQAKVATTPPTTVDSSTALEERYARRAVSEIDSGDDYETAAKGQEAVIKSQIAQDVLQTVRSRYDDQSWAGWGFDFAKGLIPGVTWASLPEVEGVTTDAIMTGEYKRQLLEGLRFLPPAEYKAKLQEAADSMNPQEAMDFISSAVQYSTSDRYLDNLFFGLDATDVATLGVGAVVKGVAKGGAKKAMKDLVKEVARPDMTNADLKVIKGDVKGAADEMVQDRLARVGATPAKNANPQEAGAAKNYEVVDKTKQGPALMDPENFARGSKSMSNERARATIEYLDDIRSTLTGTLKSDHVVVRTSKEFFEAQAAKVEQRFKTSNYRMEQAVVEAEPVRESAERFGGADYVKFWIGKKDGLSFNSAEQAENYGKNFYKFLDGSYEVEQKGNSYYLTKREYLDETDWTMRDKRIGSKNKAPETWVNRYLGFLRSSDDVLGQMTRDNAKVATYGANTIFRQMVEVGSTLKLGKNEASRLNKVMSNAMTEKRTVIDPVTKQPTQVSGKFYNNVADLETAYMKAGYSLPSEKETKAYFAFREIMNFDHNVRNISVYRDKARRGLSQQQIGWYLKGEDGKQKYVQSDFFEGKVIDELPPVSQGPYGIAWINHDTGKATFRVSNNNFIPKMQDEIKDLLSNGYKIIEVDDDRPLKGLVQDKGEGIDYLIVRDNKTKPLSVNQVPYNEGGHWNYPQGGFYAKFANVRTGGYTGRKLYDGDTSFHYFDTEVEGQKFVKSYNEALRMIKANDPALDAFAARNLPYSGAELRQMAADKVIDVNSPFVLTRSGQSVGDTADMTEMFRSGQMTDRRKKISGGNTQYTQQRSERLTSVHNTGTEANPVFKLHGAPLMDPLDTLAKSASDLSKMRYFSDYQHQAVEDWISQFHRVADVPIDVLRRDPMEFFHNPKWREGVNDEALAAGKNSLRSLKYIMTVDSPEMGKLKWMQQSTVDKILKSAGKDSRLMEAYRWNEKGADPATVLRSMAFHMKLGLLNVVQYPLQAQSIIHVAAVDGSPTRALQANFLAWSMRMRGLSETNKGVQSGIAKAVSKVLGVDQHTVDEMYDWYLKSGMNIVEGEYSKLDDYLNPREFYKNGVKQGLDAATIFFKEGNLTHRGTAFATAFLRFRQANPLKKITAEDMRDIIGRADLYVVNMTRASNTAALSGNMLSVPTQFFNYAVRLNEQMIGKRLTKLEKARVVGMYGMMYGIPTAAAMAPIPGAALWPIGDSVRQYMLENNMEGDPGTVTKYLQQGIVSALAEEVTDIEWNVGQRYGPQGMSILRDLFVDGETFEAFAGAGGSTALDTLGRIAPFGRAMLGVFSGDDETYPITSDDFIDLFKEISTFNNASRAYAAVNSQAWLSKNENLVARFEKVDNVDALMIGVLGLSPQEVSDAYLKIRSNKERQAAKVAIGGEVKKNYKRGLKAAAEGNPELAGQFFKKARTALEAIDPTPEERANMFKQSVKENQPLIDKVNWQWNLRDPENRIFKQSQEQ